MNVRLIAITVLGAVGCVEATEQFDDETQEVLAPNGVSLNGVSLNGVSLNGVSLNGVSLNGVSLNGVSLNGTSLSGKNSKGTTITGTSTNATLVSTLSNGKAMTLRLDGAAKLAAPNTDLWAYNVSYYADGGWKPLCGTGVAALAVPGTWDTRSAVIGGGAYTSSTTAFTFACRATTIAKCVEMGYRTTLGRTNQLLACVRLLRGDYCGSGATHTINGNQVNLYDGIGVQADTMAWRLEGEWTPNGARCISTQSNTRFATSSLPKPICIGVTVAVSAACGTQGFANGTVIIDEIP